MRWVIGDVHGMLGPLEALLAAVDRADPDRRLLFAGDYVNRGPDSRGVLDLLVALDRARFVRGNHDDILDLIVNGSGRVPQLINDPGVAVQWFFDQGLVPTLESYGADYFGIESVAARPSHAGIRHVTDGIPTAHRSFLHELPLVLEEDDLFVCHASWAIDEPDDHVAAKVGADESLKRIVLWNRFADAEVAAVKRWRRTGYFGHTPVTNYLPDTATDLVPVTGPNVVLVDTAAALGPAGRLTAWCHEEDRY
ncbi:MAG TPA: metallophosphoesterase, partial [Tepidisphaeraceae bacterium]|nr:metallophosphoesterase [Tepidisphaeraceae bacterium]